jgi:transcriptional regulator of acetoin/glycerol metabolism
MNEVSISPTVFGILIFVVLILLYKVVYLTIRLAHLQRSHKPSSVIDLAPNDTGISLSVKLTAETKPISSDKAQDKQTTPDPSVNLQITDEFRFALNALENTNHCLFVTGEAGTGKSTLLNYFVKNTSKKVVVLALTGVAALNVDGQTIHSFFNSCYAVGVERRAG